MRSKRIVPLLTILYISMFSCTDEKKISVVQDLSGSWYACDNGEYVEYHFTQNHVIGFLEDEVDLAYVFPYGTLGDTLIVYNDVIGDFLLSKFNLSDNQLTFYKKDGTKSEFIKFSEHSVFPMEGCDLYGSNLDSIAKKHYEHMFWKRKQWFKCVSMAEEKPKVDSIDNDLEDF